MIILNDTMEGLGKPKRQTGRKLFAAKRQSTRKLVRQAQARPVSVAKKPLRKLFSPKKKFTGKTKTGKPVVVTAVVPAPRPNFINRAVETIVNGVQQVRTILPAKAQANTKFSDAELAEFQEAPSQPVGNLTPVAPVANVIAVSPTAISPSMEQIANTAIEPVGAITSVKPATPDVKFAQAPIQAIAPSQISEPIASQTAAEPVGDLKPVAPVEETDETASMMREMNNATNNQATPQAKNNTMMYVGIAAVAVIGIFIATKK